MTKLTPAMGLLTLLALFSGACRAQLYRETGDNETSLMYHLPILKKDSQVLHCSHFRKSTTNIERLSPIASSNFHSLADLIMRLLILKP